MKKISVLKTGDFKGHKDSVYAMEIDKNGVDFYSGANEGYIVKWNLFNPDEGILISKLNAAAYSLCFLDSSTLLAGASSGTIHILDLENKQERRAIKAHSAAVFDIKKTQQNRILTAGGDGIINSFDLDFNLIQSKNYSDKSARIIEFNSVQNHLAVGFSDHTIKILNAASLELIQELTAHTNSVFSCAYSPDSNFLISGGRDATLKVWDVKREYKLLLEIPAHRLHIHSIAYNQEHPIFASSSMDKTIKIWDSDTFELLKVIDKERNESHTNCINKLIWADGETLLSASDDKTLMSWTIVID